MRGVLRRVAVAGTVVAVASVGLVGCTSSSSTKPSGTSHDLLTIGETADINGWDPSSQPPFQIWPIEAVYDHLVKCDVNGKLGPGMATSWEISADKRTFTAHLRPGRKFSDGTVIDATAVEATFQQQAKVASDRYGGITFKTPDANTLSITWPKPEPLIGLRACNPWVASAKYLKSGDLNTAPVGSGPYLLDAKNTTNGSVYSFVKNPDYYAPKLYPYKRVQVRVITSETARLNALRTGQIQGATIQASSYNEAKSSGLKVLAQSSGITQFVLADRQGKVIPALGNLKVRQALNMAFDKDSIAKNLYNGLVTPVDQVFKKGNAAYLDGLKDPYPYDIERAKQLMAEAGYADGFTLTIPTLQGQDWLPILPYVTQQLAKLNITLKQKALTGPNAIPQLLSGTYPAPLFDLGTPPDSIQTIQIGILSTGYWNVEHQKDATIESLYNTAITSDEAGSTAAQQKINQYIVDQAWFVPLVAQQSLYAYSDKLDLPKSSDFNGIAPNLVDFR